jgi:hypothetical protein
VAEEQIGVAGGAEVAHENVLGWQACGQELRAIGFPEIEMDVFGGWLVPGGTHVEPLEGIGLFTAACFVEIVGRVSELRGEFDDEVGGNFVAAGTDGRADGGEEMRGLAAELELHAADSFLGNAREGAAPSGVNRGDRALFGIDKENGNAVGGLDAEEQAGAIGGGGVAFASIRGRLREWPNHVGVNLFQGHELKLVRAKNGLKKAAVFDDIFAGVPFHEAEVQNLLGFELADATWAGTETVDEPRDSGERGEFEDLQAARTAETPGRGYAEGRRRRWSGLTRATPP